VLAGCPALDAAEVARRKAMGFKLNWDLSGTFMPYQGQSVPNKVSPISTAVRTFA